MKKALKYVALSFILLICASASSAKGEPCVSLDGCIARLKELAKNHGPGLSEQEQALIDRIDSFDGAVDKLVLLLADPNENIADLAAASLRDGKSIDKKYLPQIVAGLDRKLGWLAPALARIDSPEAAKEAVQRLLVSESAPHNQEAYAVRLLGKRAIPYILAAASCKQKCGETDHYYLGYVLGEMAQPERREAAIGLMRIVEDATDTSVARGVLTMIQGLGKPGLAAEADLLALMHARPDLLDEINQTLVGIESNYAAVYFIEALKRSPDVGLLRELAGIGIAGQDAGPVVEQLLTNPDWDVRLNAAITLGFIHYEKAAPKLINLLADSSDVRLNWAAADALGRLKAQSARNSLAGLSRNHWHPGVRKAASEALLQIDAQPGPPAEDAADGRSFYSFAYENFGFESCDATRLMQVKESSAQKLRYSTSKKKLESLVYQSEIVSYGAGDEEQQKAEGKTIIEVTPGNMVRHVEMTNQVPGVALRTREGWLAGSNRGEWGGELVFIKDGGQAKRILDENIEDIYLLGDRYIAVTGLAHMSMNNGMLFELVPDNSGQWSAKPWRSLPGAPNSSWLVETGEILVNTHSGGSVLVAKDGSMRMAACTEEKNKTN